MSAQVHSVPGQTEGRSKAFLEWKSIDLSHELSLIYVGVMFSFQLSSAILLSKMKSLVFSL